MEKKEEIVIIVYQILRVQVTWPYYGIFVFISIHYQNMTCDSITESLMRAMLFIKQCIDKDVILFSAPLHEKKELELQLSLFCHRV